jgi:hypothetical protein
MNGKTDKAELLKKLEEYRKRKYTVEQVDYAFGSTNNQVSDDFRVALDTALSELTGEIVDWVTSNILFVSSEDLAFFLNRKELMHVKGLVFLSEKLKDKSKDRQVFCIAHEVAHAKLGHRSAIGWTSKEEYEQQEKEADNLARKWLRQE